MGHFILNTMTRMYYKKLTVDNSKEPAVITETKDIEPYTTGRSISDILDQIRPFIPNMQKLFAELLDE